MLLRLLSVVAISGLCFGSSAVQKQDQHNLRQLEHLPVSPQQANADLAKVEADRCTTIIVGAKAGTEGPMTTHTADCLDCDFRVNKVPARDWPTGSMRPLFLYKGAYPSIVTPDRGATWHPNNLEGNPEQLAAWRKGSVKVAEIPQVPHTYAMFEGGYGIMNEHQVAIGESTCASKFYAFPVTAGGKARIEVSEMSKIALERTTTAKDAIQLMGKLAVEMGFYAADWTGGDASKGEGGEALTVVDKTEAWVFHVTADDTGTSAIWAAQRVAPDHVAAVANSFVIREIDPDSDDFMYSDNIFEVAERNGFWTKKSGKKLDFSPAFGPERSHPEYATRRVWRIFSLVAPSLNLPAHTDAYADDYPFSVKAERKLSPQDLIAIERDHYEGTEFDLTQGLAAGPFGDPTRFDVAPTDNQTFKEVLHGGFDRSISMFRTSYSFVAQARAAVPDQLALLWFGVYNPASCSFAPFYVSADHVPAAYTRGSLFRYDPTIAFWNFAVVGNYAARFYKYAIKEIRALQKEIQDRITPQLQQLETEIMAIVEYDPYGGPDHGGKDFIIATKLTDFTNKQGNYINDAWKNFLPFLITKFHDGYVAGNLDGDQISMTKLFYPKWWLEAVGYFDKNKGNFGPGVILFEPSPTSGTGGGVNAMGVLSACILTSMASVALTLYVLHRQNHHLVKQGYTSIECAEVK